MPVANSNVPGIVRCGKLTLTEYTNLHKWVYKTLGKPLAICWDCNITDAKKYEWANKSNDYLKEPTDWEWLCRSCHKLKDSQYNEDIDYARTRPKFAAWLKWMREQVSDEDRLYAKWLKTSQEDRWIDYLSGYNWWEYEEPEKAKEWLYAD